MKKQDSLLSIFLIFLRFGLLAWGGPVAQIAMIRDELVGQRKWITPEKFMRVLAVYQALPGPEAHELCVYFGMIRKGRLGGFLAGLGFMLPGFVLILLLSWAYVLLGPAVLLPLFVGVTPAVTALIARALYRIGKHTITGPSLLLAACISFALTLQGISFIWIFLICAIWEMLWAREKHGAALIVLTVMCAAIYSPLTLPAFAIDLPSSQNLFVQGLKAGLLSFGGAYTALPFLKESMVGAYGAITPQAFMDGIALSSIIPAPLVIFGTYLGYLAGGFTGAILVTLGIFIPAFSFTLIGHKYLEKIVENPAMHGFLNGIAAAVVGLLAVTTLQIMLDTLTGFYAAAIFAAALAALILLRKRWVIPAVMIACGLAGLALPL